MKHLIVMIFTLAFSNQLTLAAEIAKRQDIEKLWLAEVSSDKVPNFVQVRYQNRSAVDAKISRQELENPVFALRIVNAAGLNVLTIPPPLPWLRPETVMIPAGGKRIERYSLDGMFIPPLPQGRYKVSVRLDGWQSMDAEINIQPPGD